jgi:hypothetical protein
MTTRIKSEPEGIPMMTDKGQSIADNTWKIAVAVSGVLVVLVLITNMISLALSFTPVYDESPVIYESGVDGNLTLPYLPTSVDDFILEAPEIVMEGRPFSVSASTPSNEVTYLPLNLRVKGPGGSERRFQLNDGFENGSWRAWTIIPGNLPIGNHSFGLEYRSPYISIEIEGNNRIVEIIESNNTFPIPDIDDTLVADGNLSFDLEGEGDFRLELVTSDGTVLDIPGSVNGTFAIDPNEVALQGWERIRVRLLEEGSVREVFGDYLVKFVKKDEVEISDFFISAPLAGYDDLYEQYPERIDVLETEGDLELLTKTYYFFNLFFSWEHQDSDIPLPNPILSLEGKKIFLRPANNNGKFQGIFRSPGSYNDHEDDGLIIRLNRWGDNDTILEKDFVLRSRQSPEIRFEPDPYFDPANSTDGLTLFLEEGWELVSYRDFRGAPNITLEEDVVDSFRSIEEGDTGDIIRYSSDLPVELDGRSLGIYAKAEFQMEVRISFIFFTFPFTLSGWMVPGWFTLISVAITASLLAIAFRSGRYFQNKQRYSKDGKKLSWIESDVLVLSTTYMGALFFSWVIVIMFELMNQPTPVPSILSDQTPIWIRMILLADASVWEEIVSRVMFIGIPLLIFHPSKKWNLERFKVLFGGSGSFGTAEVALILISSSFFGLAHLGWGAWKVIPTFVTGALFGYLYIRVGLHAAIAMHFLFDYDGFIYDLLDYPYYQLYVVYYAALVLGGFFLAWILVRFKRWIENRSGKIVNKRWLLIVHSFLVIILFLFIFLTDGVTDYAIALTIVPFLNAGALLLESSESRIVPVGLTQIMVLISSMISLALAPIGLMWILNDEHFI